ncbi:MAG: hypothetical protein IPN76_31900 [Saprospiraceae bacterium]|nr:hypothetical protein [Saprospiraceae bacterium]
MPSKAALKELISQGNTKLAIQAMLDTTKLHSDGELHNAIVQISNRYEKMKREEMLGITDRDDLNRESANINLALLGFIDQLHSGQAAVASQTVILPSITPPLSGTGTGNPTFTGTGDGGGAGRTTGTGDGGGQKPSNIAWIVGLALLVGMVLLLVFVPCPTDAQFFAFRLLLALAAGGLATLLPGMFGLDLNNGTKAAGALGIMVLIYLVNPGTLAGGGKCDEGPFNFTVRLVKPNNMANYPPLKGGTLKIWVVDRYEKPELNTDLVAEVKAIPNVQDGNMVDAYLEGATYWKLEKDSVRLSKLSQTLNVVPDGSLDTLYGKTLMNDNPVVGVQIEVEGGLSGVSDANGKFVVPIPLMKQKEVLLVSAFKEGYGRVEERHNPASGEKVLDLTMTKKAASTKYGKQK